MLVGIILLHTVLHAYLQDVAHTPCLHTTKSRIYLGLPDSRQTNIYSQQVWMNMRLVGIVYQECFFSSPRVHVAHGFSVSTPVLVRVYLMYSTSSYVSNSLMRDSQWQIQECVNRGGRARFRILTIMWTESYALRGGGLHVPPDCFRNLECNLCCEQYVQYSTILMFFCWGGKRAGGAGMGVAFIGYRCRAWSATDSLSCYA